MLLVKLLTKLRTMRQTIMVKEEKVVRERLPAQNLPDLERTARFVLRQLQTLSLPNLKIAIIGGMAVSHYQHRAKTDDVDFLVTCDDPRKLKEELIRLGGGHFAQYNDLFKHHPTPILNAAPAAGGGGIPIEFVPATKCPYLPPAARPLMEIDADDDDLPYIEFKNLLVFKIQSCGKHREWQRQVSDWRHVWWLFLRLGNTDNPLPSDTLQFDSDQKRLLEEGFRNMDNVNVGFHVERRKWEKKLLGRVSVDGTNYGSFPPFFF